jgi:DNA mismatch endonuclease (patch repair protein)
MERILRKLLPNGKFASVPVQRSRSMAAVKGKRNKSTEWKLRAALVRAGIRGWAVTPRSVPGTPDFYFRDRRLAVFVDGCFWHNCPTCGHVPNTNSVFWKAKLTRTTERDLHTTESLTAQDIHVLRFWEHEIHDGPSSCLERIAKQLA